MLEERGSEGRPALRELPLVIPTLPLSPFPPSSSITGQPQPPWDRPIVVAKADRAPASAPPSVGATSPPNAPPVLLLCAIVGVDVQTVYTSHPSRDGPSAAPPATDCPGWCSPLRFWVGMRQSGDAQTRRFYIPCNCIQRALQHDWVRSSITPTSRCPPTRHMAMIACFVGVTSSPPRGASAGPDSSRRPQEANLLHSTDTFRCQFSVRDRYLQ